MIYQCPSCHLLTKDDIEPQDFVSEPLCIFCSTRHNEKERLNWQLDHINEIPIKFHGKIMRHMFKYLESKF